MGAIGDPMNMSFSCPKCNGQLNCEFELAGKPVYCVLCKYEFTAPNQEVPSPVIDFFVTVSRLPIGIIGMVVVLLFFVAIWVIETALVVIFLPVIAITGTRRDTKKSWVANYPNTAPLRNILEGWIRIGKWIRND